MIPKRLLLFLAVCALLLSECPLLRAASDWEVIRSGERKWELLLADLEQARSYICLECFIIHDDPSGSAVQDLLIRKAREGLQVRLIFDLVGCAILDKYFLKALKKAGAEVRIFSDLDRWNTGSINIRDHRKILVIDGKVAHMGGMNLNDKYHYKWNDTDIRMEGAPVSELERIFFATWNRLGEKGSPGCQADSQLDNKIEIIAGGPFYPIFVKRYLKVLREAKDHIYIQTPYFCPPDTLATALKEAAARGVDVRIIIPAQCDLVFMNSANQSYCPDMLEAGVRIYEYLPRFDHSKVFTCDDRLCWVGSVNFDNRSFYLSYEIGASIQDEQTAIEQKHWFLGLLAESREITREQADAWSKGRRMKQRIIRWFEHLL